MEDGLPVDEGEEYIEFLSIPPGRYPLSSTLTFPADLHALAEMIPGTKVCRMLLVEYLRLLEERKMAGKYECGVRIAECGMKT